MSTDRAEKYKRKARAEEDLDAIQVIGHDQMFEENVKYSTVELETSAARPSSASRRRAPADRLSNDTEVDDYLDNLYNKEYERYTRYEDEREREEAERIAAEHKAAADEPLAYKNDIEGAEFLPDEGDAPLTPAGKKNKKLIIAIVVLCIAVLAVAVPVLISNFGGSGSPGSGGVDLGGITAGSKGKEEALTLDPNMTTAIYGSTVSSPDSDKEGSSSSGNKTADSSTKAGSKDKTKDKTKDKSSKTTTEKGSQPTTTVQTTESISEEPGGGVDEEEVTDPPAPAIDPSLN